MRYRIFGRTGLSVSELGLGGHEYRRPLPTTLGRWGDIDLEKFMKGQPQRNELVKRALEAGINYFDATQPEEAKSLGMALREMGERENVHVALMILRPLSKIAEEPRNKWKEIIIDDVRQKLELLQSGYTDILNVHMPEIQYSSKRLTAVIEVLRGLQEEGKIGSIAASSHRPRFLAELLRTYDCFDAVMVRYNYHLQEAGEHLFPLCKALEVGVAVMKPLAWPYYGIPFTKFSPLVAERSLNPAQTSIRWILQVPEVSTIVTGMNTLTELNENVEAVEKSGEIDERVLKQYLDAAQSQRAIYRLRELIQNPAVDLHYFAERALQDM